MIGLPISALIRKEVFIDYDICGDASLKGDIDVIEKLFIGEIVDICLKNSPDEWFPRGKWATI